MNNYPHHIGDFLRDTVGLSMTEECVYRRLLDQYYAREGPLPLELPELCRLARAMTPTEKRAVAYVVGRFFEKTSDGVTQKRADAELQKFRERSEKARESIAHRWHPDTNVLRSNAERNTSQKPVASNQKPVASTQALNPKVKTLPAGGKTAPPPGRVLSEEQKAHARAVWQAYLDAYQRRYGVPPVRNAKTNAAVVELCRRLPADEAPLVAAFFVASNSKFYVTKGHSLGLLLADAEKLRTEWATGRAMTDTEARQADRTAAIGNTFGRLIEERKNGTEG
jgi:uncharacterized protein YdaU (DUF1376 family)